MTNFVMVINEVTTEELAKILEIQARSGDRLCWVSQGHPAPNNAQNQPVVFSPQMQQTMKNLGGNPPKQEAVYNFVRLEWPVEAAHFAREVFNLFVREEKKEAAQAG